MNKAQVQEITRLREAARKAGVAHGRKLEALRKASAKCDHFYGNNRSAAKRQSTHNAMTCGGFHECAVCAGEQQETFAKVCQICKRIV